MKAVNLTAAVVLSTMLAFEACSAEPTFEQISRCFFVYAPIFQVGRDLPHNDLFHFGQARIGFIGGYLAANKTNRQFTDVFEANLAANKSAAERLEASLRSAISTRNQSLFASVLNQAVACDAQVGISTDSIPKL